MYFTFSRPEYLWYLLSIPLLIVSHYAFLKYARRRAIQFANFQALKRVSDQKIVTRNHAVLIIRIFILLSLIIAISGTTLWYKGMTNDNDIILTLDISSSMTAQDFTPSRLEAAKEYMVFFVDRIESDSKIGVVSFAGAAFIECLLTDDKGKVKDSINNIVITSASGTNIPDAIITSSNLLLGSDKGKTIILLTDGSNTLSYFTKDPIAEGIKYAKENNVIIYTIGIGSNTEPIGYLPEYYNVSAVYDEANLIKIANETGGTYYNAINVEELSLAYSDILSNTREAYLSKDLSGGLMIIALALIFLEWGLISTRFRAIPK